MYVELHLFEECSIKRLKLHSKLFLLVKVTRIYSGRAPMFTVHHTGLSGGHGGPAAPPVDRVHTVVSRVSYV